MFTVTYQCSRSLSRSFTCQSQRGEQTSSENRLPFPHPLFLSFVFLTYLWLSFFAGKLNCLSTPVALPPVPDSFRFISIHFDSFYWLYIVMTLRISFTRMRNDRRSTRKVIFASLSHSLFIRRHYDAGHKRKIVKDF
jgi:hypothetical protein